MTAGLTSTPGSRGRCRCVPCLTPQYGAPGWAHCAACCYGTGVEEYDHACPVAGHAEMAELQNPARRAVAPAAAADRLLDRAVTVAVFPLALAAWVGMTVAVLATAPAAAAFRDSLAAAEAAAPHLRKDTR